MEMIKREIKDLEKKTLKLEAIGFNSKGTLTFVFEDGTLFNFHYGELETIKKFLNKIQL